MHRSGSDGGMLRAVRASEGESHYHSKLHKNYKLGTVLFALPFFAIFRHRQADHWLDATANLCKIAGHAIAGFFLSVPAFHEC
jgi:hypothetical protein